MDLFKEISVPVLIVKTPEALVVRALPRTIPGKGSEFLILQEERRNSSLDFQCQARYEFTLVVSPC